MATIDNMSWRIFLALERELIDTNNFVEFHSKNYETFSIRYRSIILQACSEIDLIFKHICGIKPEEHGNITKYLEFINGSAHKDFFNTIVHLPIYNLGIKPWHDCDKNTSPDFWKANNVIKHQGDLQQATLITATRSLAALFSLLLAWYIKSNGKNFSQNENIELPVLFSYPGLGAINIVMEGAHNIALPGF